MRWRTRSKVMANRLNHPAAGNAGFAAQFAIERHWPDVPQPGCWAVE